MKNSETNIQELTKKFALDIIRLYQYLTDQADKKEYVLSKQVLRSGTSIGANVREAVCAQTKADFGSKMNIALKEASETLYWLELLADADYISKESASILGKDCSNNLLGILKSIVKTTFENIEKEKQERKCKN